MGSKFALQSTHHARLFVGWDFEELFQGSARAARSLHLRVGSLCSPRRRGLAIFSRA